MTDPFGTRWTALRKADIVNRIRSGDLAREAAMDRYQISVEELHAWERYLDAYGVGGLSIGSLRAFRQS